MCAIVFDCLLVEEAIPEFGRAYLLELSGITVCVTGGWERIKLGNGKLPKLRTISKKRTESQPSGARCVRRLFAFNSLSETQPTFRLVNKP